MRYATCGACALYRLDHESLGKTWQKARSTEISGARHVFSLLYTLSLGHGYLILASADYQSAAPSATSGPVMIALRISKTPIVAIVIINP